MKIPQLQFRPQDVRYVYLYDITDFKTATSQQKDALANTREDPYSKKSKELQTHLQCDDHPGKFCFKASNIRGVSRPSDHVQLDAVAIRDWATAILNDSATLTCPPRTPEFEDILSNTCSRSKSSSNVQSQWSTPAPSSTAPIIFQFDRNGPFKPSAWSPSPPRTPARCRPVNSMPFSSPLVAHDTFDEFDRDGLLTFLTWCEQKYKIREGNLEFKDAYRILKTKGIDVDVLKEKDANWVEKQGVMTGTADRIAKTYPKWLLQLK